MPLNTLPMWIQFGALFLAMNAGMVNVLGLLTVLHQSVSHMTGNVSMLASAILAGHTASIIYLLCILLCYVLGSLYSGLILAQTTLSLNRRYGLPLSLMAVCLVLCWFFLPIFPRYALLWAAVAMGMQNAMVSHYHGAIIRTTHLSGVLTDLGLALGYRLRGLPVAKRRILLHLLILVGFFIGGLIATWSYPLLQLNAFLIPASLSFVLSAVYWVIYLRAQQHQSF